MRIRFKCAFQATGGCTADMDIIIIQQLLTLRHSSVLSSQIHRLTTDMACRITGTNSTLAP
jgi:hypothetical protein